MRQGFRTYLAIALSLLLILTGQTMAVARGASSPMGEVVLCTATGTVTVYLDENGEPTVPGHLCPDCALHYFTAVLPPDPAVATVPRTVRPSSVRESLASTVPVIRQATARAPPA